MWIGYDDVDRLITYPDVHNLSGCSQPIHMRSLIHPKWPILAVFHSTGLRFGDYTPSSHALTAANWGNRTIRTATRRRHAGRQLLMLPNPHRCRRGATGEPASLAAVFVGGGGD